MAVDDNEGIALAVLRGHDGAVPRERFTVFAGIGQSVDSIGIL